MLKDEDIKYIAKAIPFWSELNEEDKRFLLDHIFPVQYEKGNSIHSGSMDCIGVLLIRTGDIRVYILSDEGKEVTLYRMSDGDICILSASCILDNITFDVYMDAESDCDLLVIESKFYKQLCSHNIYAENFTQKMVIDRFSDVMWAMEQILFMSFDKRLAIFLSDESARTGSDVIELTHEQIAKYVGSAREVVSRMLKYFQEEGIVALSRGGVKIVNKKKLKALIK